MSQLPWETSYTVIIFFSWLKNTWCQFSFLWIGIHVITYVVGILKIFTFWPPSIISSISYPLSPSLAITEITSDNLSILPAKKRVAITLSKEFLSQIKFGSKFFPHNHNL